MNFSRNCLLLTIKIVHRWQVNTVMNFDISHVVDDSDIAFSMRLDRSSTICSMLGSKGSARHRVSTSLDAFVNLPTLNYLLAGIQLCYIPTSRDKSKWFDLLYDMDKERFHSNDVKLTFLDIRHIVRELIRPFGVVRGSEKQGGQDETGLSAATWPVNFVANLVLDGHDRNVVNIWHYHDINAGDDLVLRLKPMPIPRGRDGYTLNHYYKRYVQQNFEGPLARPVATHVWQLVPDVFDFDSEPENDIHYGNPHIHMSPGFDVPKDYVWQEHGFWHIGRSQVMVRKYATAEYYNNDMANSLKINHLDLTFEPTWTKVPGETTVKGDRRAVVIDYDIDAATGKYSVRGHRDASRIAPGLMAGSKRTRWAPDLNLEAFLFGPMPGSRDALASGKTDMDAKACPADMHGDAADRLLGGGLGVGRAEWTQGAAQDGMADDDAGRLFGAFDGCASRGSAATTSTTSNTRSPAAFLRSSFMDYGDSPLTASLMPIDEDEMGAGASMADERPSAASVASSAAPPAASKGGGGLGALLSAGMIKPKKPKKTVSINE